MKQALIIVDVQNDFLPGGALAVNEGDRVIPVINQIMKTFQGLVVTTRDVHPVNHSSFTSNGGKWPAHCVRFTYGSGLSSKLVFGHPRHGVLKGTQRDDDGYSAFSGYMLNWTTDHKKTLPDWLLENEVLSVDVCGLALDYCVKATALDAIKYGFKCRVLLDATRAVDVQNWDPTLRELKTAGVELISSI